MEGSKEYFLIMRKEHFENQLTPFQRSLFLSCEVRESNEYETHKKDDQYIKLKKAERKAKKDLQEYLFNKRHK